MLNIALPKGRLGDQVYELLASVGMTARVFTTKIENWCLRTHRRVSATCS